MGKAEEQGLHEEARQPVTERTPRPRGRLLAEGHAEAPEVPREVGPLAASGAAGRRPGAARRGHRRGGAALLPVGAAPLHLAAPGRRVRGDVNLHI